MSRAERNALRETLLARLHALHKTQTKTDLMNKLQTEYAPPVVADTAETLDDAATADLLQAYNAAVRRGKG